MDRFLTKNGSFLPFWPDLAKMGSFSNLDPFSSTLAPTKGPRPISNRPTNLYTLFSGFARFYVISDELWTQRTLVGFDPDPFLDRLRTLFGPLFDDLLIKTHGAPWYMAQKWVKKRVQKGVKNDPISGPLLD